MHYTERKHTETEHAEGNKYVEGKHVEINIVKETCEKKHRERGN